jgi:hypothetical protein
MMRRHHGSTNSAMGVCQLTISAVFVSRMAASSSVSLALGMIKVSFSAVKPRSFVLSSNCASSIVVMFAPNHSRMHLCKILARSRQHVQPQIRVHRSGTRRVRGVFILHHKYSHDFPLSDCVPLQALAVSGGHKCLGDWNMARCVQLNADSAPTGALWSKVLTFEAPCAWALLP